ncbi:VOC family protein [Promicromonospora kroppenstedtii]|uniref:VOC family protein n=1 Tax=Promicromonospora kroppenstedtii TaxID=440482 RepID=A0ABW7XPK6_9MICO
MARLHDVVFDCRHPASLARFWAIVLDGYAVAPYDDEELARLHTIGVHDPEDDPSVLVEGPAGAPRLFFNAVPEPKAVKNRVHLDVRAPDRDAEVARLVAAGAAEIGRNENWVVMTDPEGNEFCVFPD